jgi:hypothetical protein
MTEPDRVRTRAGKLLPEEKDAGSDDPRRQAGAILEESDERQGDRTASPATHLEHRRSEDIVPPVDGG